MLNWFQKNTDVKILIIICTLILFVLFLRIYGKEYFTGGDSNKDEESTAMEKPKVSVNIGQPAETYTLSSTEYYEPRTHNSAISLQVNIQVPDTDNALNINSVKLVWGIKDGIEHTWDDEDFKGKKLKHSFNGSDLGDINLSSVDSKLIQQNLIKSNT